MASSSPSASAREGATAKLFAVLAALGAVAVVGAATLGYLGAKDALERAILNGSG
jgi:Flp pilus assembly pilin Flp